MIPLLREEEYQRTIIETAAWTGWRVAHFRPARVGADGARWRTAVEGDGAGFPDLLMVHPEAGFVWFVEIKRDDNRTLSPDQEAWGIALTRAAATYEVLYVPSGLRVFLRKMQDARKTRLQAIWAEQ